MDSKPLFCVVGMTRSGTIWTTRLLADTLNLAADTREGDFQYERDAVIWRRDREGAPIRRLHYLPADYPYDRPVVLVIRDPRQIAVSQVFFYDHKNDFNSHARLIIGKWINFMTAWEKDERVATTVKYEDLRFNPWYEVVRIINRLDLKFDATRLHDAVEANDISVMENWAKRKGDIDEWKQYLNTHTLQRIEDRAGDLMRKYGYE